MRKYNVSLARIHPFKIELNQFEGIIRQIVARVISAELACEIYIFGSYVEGGFTGESDLDIAIIVPDATDRKLLLQYIYISRGFYQSGRH